MSFEYVTVEQNGNVLLVTLNRPRGIQRDAPTDAS